MLNLCWDIVDSIRISTLYYGQCECPIGICIEKIRRHSGAVYWFLLIWRYIMLRRSAAKGVFTTNRFRRMANAYENANSLAHICIETSTLCCNRFSIVNAVFWQRQKNKVSIRICAREIPFNLFFFYSFNAFP